MLKDQFTETSQLTLDDKAVITTETELANARNDSTLLRYAKPVCAAAAALILGGCMTSPGTFGPTQEQTLRFNRAETRERSAFYGGHPVDLGTTVDQLDPSKIQVTAKPNWYTLPASLIEAAETHYNNKLEVLTSGDALKKGLSEADAKKIKDGVLQEKAHFMQVLKEYELQNRILCHLFQASKIQRATITDMENNVDSDGLIVPAQPLTEQESRDVVRISNDLKNSLRRLTKQDRDLLCKVTGGGDNQDYIEMTFHNADYLQQAYELAVISKRAHHHEFNIAGIRTASDLQNEISNSILGKDMYGEGEWIFNQMQNLPLKFLARPESQIGQLYDDAEDAQLTLRQIFDKQMTEVGEEAGSWDHQSLHNVAIGPYAMLKNLASEAHGLGRLVTPPEVNAINQDASLAPQQKLEKFQEINDRRWTALNSYLVKRVSDKLGSVKSEGYGFDDFLWSICPIYSGVAMFNEAGAAFSIDDFEPTAEDYKQAIMETITRGGQQEYGIRSGHNFKGDKMPSFWRFLGATVSTGAQGQQGYVFAKNYLDKKAAERNAPGPASVFGGDTGGSHTTNPGK